MFWSKPKTREVTYTTPSGKFCNLYADAIEQPHLLVAGATGSGKSVIINGLVHTMLYRLPFDQQGGAQMILIDPKRVELSAYRSMPHTIRYASEPADMVAALGYAMDLTEQRFQRMQKSGDKKYNGSDVYVIIDEFADLILTQRKVVAPLIQRLAQIGRAARVHIILATQTPISKVLPTEIKCNFDARFGLRTRSAQDSRNIIGKTGLELLPKYGKGYYMKPGAEHYYSIPMIDDAEMSRVLAWWNEQKRLNGIK